MHKLPATVSCFLYRKCPAVYVAVHSFLPFKVRKYAVNDGDTKKPLGKVIEKELNESCIELYNLNPGTCYIFESCCLKF
jgi:hypothetical protein